MGSSSSFIDMRGFEYIKLELILISMVFYREQPSQYLLVQGQQWKHQN